MCEGDSASWFTSNLSDDCELRVVGEFLQCYYGTITEHFNSSSGGEVKRTTQLFKCARGDTKFKMLGIDRYQGTVQFNRPCPEDVGFYQVLFQSLITER